MTDASQTANARRISPSRRLMVASTWLILAQALMAPLGLATLVYLTRQLGPTVYGRYATVMAVLVWLEFVLSCVFSRSGVKVVSHAKAPREAAGTILRWAIGVGLMGMIGMWALAWPLAVMLHVPTLVGPMRLAAVDVPLFVVGRAYLASISGLGKFERQAAAIGTRWPVRLGLVILLIEAGFDLSGAIIAVIGSSAGVLLVCAVLCPIGPWRGQGLGRRTLWAVTLPLFGSALALRVLDGVDLLMLQGYQTSSATVGVYAAAMNLTVMPGLVGAALTPTLLSTMADLHKADDMDEVSRLGSMVVRLGAWAIPPAAAVTMMSQALVRLFFGADYAAAAPLFAILLWAGIARMFISTAAGMLAGAGRSMWTWWAIAPSVPVAIVGYLVLIPLAGPIGAAWSTTAAAGLGVGLSIWLLSSRLQIEAAPKTAVQVAATTAGVVVPPLFLDLTGPWIWLYLGLSGLVTAGLALGTGQVSLPKPGNQERG